MELTVFLGNQSERLRRTRERLDWKLGSLTCEFQWPLTRGETGRGGIRPKIQRVEAKEIIG